jgi:hypothetical protein
MNMDERKTTLLVVLLLMLAASPALADDLTGSRTLLCTTVQTTVCLDEGECITGPPWRWNIPQFIIVDLEQKQLRTTKASGEDRTTPIKNMVHDDGQIVLQGVELQRAFSFVIHESSGEVSIAVALDGVAIAAFGACTTLAQE